MEVRMIVIMTHMVSSMLKMKIKTRKINSNIDEQNYGPNLSYEQIGSGEKCIFIKTN